MTPRSSVTVHSIIDQGVWTRAQKFATLLAAGSIAMDGLDIQILGFAVPSISLEWHLAKSSFTSIFALSLLAISAGTLIGGFLGDRFGRRIAIICAVLWFAVSTILLSTSGTLGALFFWRLLSGLGIGAALPNATAFIAEVTPAHRRSAVLSATIVCIPLGGFAGGIIAARVLPIASWRVLILIAGILPFLLALVLFFTLPESPRFLAALVDGRDRMTQSLARLGIRVDKSTNIQFETLGGHKEGINALVQRPYFTNLLSLWSAFGFCLTSVYFVFNWLPSMLSTVGLGAAAASSGLAIYNFGGIIGSVLLGLWMNRVGSRLPMLLATAGSIATALWLALHLITPTAGTPLLTFQLGLHGFFVNAVQTALYALAAHIYPTRLRSRGVAVASACGRTGAILSAFLGGAALHHSGRTYFFVLCISLTGVGASLVFLRDHIPARSDRGNYMDT